MKRIVLTTVAVAATMLVTPVAHADNGDTIHGGCFVDSYATPPPYGSANAGVIGDESASTTGQPPAPIGATVTCWLQVNGVDLTSTRHTYGDGTSAVQAGTDPVTYTAGPTDSVGLCERDDFADGTSATTCFALGDDIQVPPQFVLDLTQEVLGNYLDPVLCAVNDCPPDAATS